MTCFSFVTNVEKETWSNTGRYGISIEYELHQGGWTHIQFQYNRICQKLQILML